MTPALCSLGVVPVPAGPLQREPQKTEPHYTPLTSGADIVAKPKGFVERDFLEAPKFTQPLADHTSTPGYSTQLFCSVRASPKVRGPMSWASAGPTRKAPLHEGPH